MDLSEIRNRIQVEYGDLNQAQVVNATILRWINSGQLDVVRKTNCLATSSNVAFSIGAVTVALPATFLKYLDSGYTLGGYHYSLNLIDYEDLRRLERPNALTPVGSPDRIYIRPEFNVVGLYPLPDSAVTVVLDHIKRPTPLVNDADIPEIPVQYHDILPLYVLMRAAKADDDVNRAQMYENEYNLEIANILSDAQNPDATQFAQVRGVDDW